MPKTLDDFLVDDPSPTPDDNKPVPNKFPTIKNVPYKIAIIGEAPGVNEVAEGQPFVGASGKVLNGFLSKAGILREACFVGNICQHRPPENDISKFAFDGEQIQSGLTQLYKDLATFQPNICLLLGKTALFAAKRENAIGDWRGSIFQGTNIPFLGRKCLASYHPAACLRQWEWSPLLMFDIKKALAEATTPSLILPERNLFVDITLDYILHEFDRIIADKIQISPDIEGYVDAMTCISLADKPSYSFIVPLTHHDGTNRWSIEDEAKIWTGLSKVMSAVDVPKVMQNGLYDRFVLQYSYNIITRGRQDDTMLKFWELYCELEKSLGFQCSLITKEPFYKFERKVNDARTHHTYCCRDSAVTIEINSALDKWLDQSSRRHYKLNIDLLNPILYMELRGIKYDTEKAKQKLTEVDHAIYSLQSDLNDCVGCGILPNESRLSLLQKLQSQVCFKRDPTQPKKGREEEYRLCRLILSGNEPLTKRDKGYLSTVLDTGLNIKSAAFKTLLYTTLNLPKQYHPVTKELTTNYEALLKLTKKSSHPCLTLALDIGELRTRSQMLAISADKDGRIRCGYNIVGTETGRLTCYTSPTGSGYNLQTIPSENQLKPVGHPLRSGMRDLFVADEGHYLFQCDLSGADGWTVAAHLATLGDSTMLDDYQAGIKPAKILCYLLRHSAGSLAGRSREEIKELTKEVGKDSWDYFACKIGQHGTCYLMGKRKLVNQIFIQSEGKVSMAESDVVDLQRLFTIRYRIKLWHDWMTRHLSKQPYPPKLTSASGHTRRFFGRYNEILGEALAHEPQANTTYATNLAAYRLWTDRDNRIIRDTKCKLRIEPLHQVHDALLCQARIEDTDWAVAKLKSYFNNPITIAGQPITIPFEGNYGPSWGDLPNAIK